MDRGIEQYSVLRALKALKRANVALLLIDATDGVTAQDTHIAGYILDELKSTIVLVNKWDAVAKDMRLTIIVTAFAAVGQGTAGPATGAVSR